MKIKNGLKRRERMMVVSRGLPILGRMMAAAALLALAALAISLPTGVQAATHHPAGLHHTHHDNPAQAGAEHAQHGQTESPGPECDASVSGCCGMVHCQTALSVTGHVFDRILATRESEAANPVRRVGTDPGIILPPPRKMSD